MAQPGSLTRGFGGRVLSVVETTPGTTPTNPTFIKLSDHIQSVALAIDPALKEYRDIGDFDVKSFVLGLPSYGLKVSFLLHIDRKTQLDDAINRQSDNSLKSQTLEVSLNRDDTTKGFFTFKGCQAESVMVKGEVGDAVLVEVSYRALSVSRVAAEPSIGSGSRESAALGALSVFSSSTITRGGSAVGYLTRSAEATVAHELSVEGVDNQTDPKVIVAGKRNITGRCDISVDDGGVALADAVLAKTAADVVFNLGTTGAPKLTFGSCVWENLTMSLGVADAFVRQAVPFRGVSVTTGTVA